MTPWILGLLAGLATAVLWTATSVFFETASRRFGSLTVNLLRLALAGLFFLVLSLVRTGAPVDPSLDARAWTWLSLSGLAGFVVGDLLLFEAFLLIGSRLSMLIYASAPPVTALLGLVFLGEGMGLPSLLGMGLILGGISLAILTRPASDSPHGEKHRVRGILLALGGSVGQAAGVVLGKLGAGTHDSFASTQVRVLAGILGFVLVVTVLGRWKAVAAAFRRASPAAAAAAGPVPRPRTAWVCLAAGSVAGPFLGVSLALLSTQLTSVGVASTLSSLSPVLILVPAVLWFRERVRLPEVLGAVLACAGVALMFV